MAGNNVKILEIKRISMGILVLILFSCIVAPAYCQSRNDAVTLTDCTQTTLDGRWKVIRGDNPEFGNPAYDDSTWQSVEVPANVQELFAYDTGYIWYRKWIFIPPNKPIYNLGIRLGKIASADETFLNGYRIGGSGSAEPDGLDNKKVRIYQIPDKILKADGYNLVAVRVNPYYTDTSGIYNEKVRIGEYSRLANQLIRSESIDLIFSSIFILLGFVFLFFFFKRWQEREHFFFGTGALCMGIYTFYGSQWRYVLSVESVYDYRLYYAASFAVAPCFARFAYECLHDRSIEQEGRIGKSFNYISQGLVIYAGIVSFLLLIYNNSVFWYCFDDLVNTYIAAFSGCTAAIYSYYMLTADVRDSKLIIFAFIIAFASGTLEAFTAKLNLPSNIVMWGVMTCVLLGTVVMTTRFFRLQDEVQEYSSGLEKLVDVRTQQLTFMEESRRRLLANICHDLRTPVSSVLGHAELLLEEIVESPEEQRTYIKRIHSKMLGLNRMIQDLLELTRIESQQELFHMAETSAAVVFENIYQKYLFDVENAGVKFESNSSILSDIMVLADEDRLDQVFANLVSNAIRYTKQDGLITISCQLASKHFGGFEIIGSSRLVCFTVADNGTGISPEHIPHIFERFYRGNEFEAFSSEHSGLGLAIAKEIVLAHGGQIWVDATVIHGCAIHFILPALP